MNREELIEHLREEIKALKAANLDLQIHFDTMKAELDEVKVLATPEPYGWVGGGVFFHNRSKAIEAAAKSPCVEVYLRSQVFNPNSSEESRRKLFEIWVRSKDKLKLPLHRFANLPFMYSDPDTSLAWLAFNAAPVQQVAAPDGWKLVPVELTEAMLDAGCKALVGSIGGYEAGQVYRCYDAMLAASPVQQETK